MNTAEIAFLAGLALAGGPSLGAQTSPAGTSAPVAAAEVPALFPFHPDAQPAAQPGSAPSQDAVVKLAPLRILSGQFPRYSEVAGACAQPGLLEPCALVKANVDARTRYDLFLAPVALENGAAGFGIARISW